MLVSEGASQCRGALDTNPTVSPAGDPTFPFSQGRLTPGQDSAHPDIMSWLS